MLRKIQTFKFYLFAGIFVRRRDMDDVFEYVGAIDKGMQCCRRGGCGENYYSSRIRRE
jgi:hypothetical protein